MRLLLIMVLFQIFSSLSLAQIASGCDATCTAFPAEEEDPEVVWYSQPDQCGPGFYCEIATEAGCQSDSDIGQVTHGQCVEEPPSPLPDPAA